MQKSDALLDLSLAFLQLEFTIKLLSFCELDHINPADFDRNHIVILDDEHLYFPSGNFSDLDSLKRAASTSVLIAMSASALVLDDAFEAFGLTRNPYATDNAGQLRALVYMIRCAYAHGIASPHWKVNNGYLRTIKIDLGPSKLRLDLRSLHEKPFEIGQIGGYKNWYRIRDEALRLLI